MLGLIAHMWKIKITLINYLGYDAEFIVFGSNDEGISHADIYIIYNGWSYYTATDTALHAHRLPCMIDFKSVAFIFFINMMYMKCFNIFFLPSSIQ